MVGKSKNWRRTVEVRLRLLVLRFVNMLLQGKWTEMSTLFPKDDAKMV
jgi:hypothetical protein